MRNFRQTYYSSLGVQSVEAKPTLESALAGSLLDVEKINKVCLWIRVPHIYRPTVWKILLGVLPVSKPAWNLVDALDHEQFVDLVNSTLAISGQTINSIPGFNTNHSDQNDLSPLIVRSPDGSNYNYGPLFPARTTEFEKLTPGLLVLCALPLLADGSIASTISTSTDPDIVRVQLGLLNPQQEQQQQQKDTQRRTSNVNQFKPPLSNQSSFNSKMARPGFTPGAGTWEGQTNAGKADYDAAKEAVLAGAVSVSQNIQVSNLDFGTDNSMMNSADDIQRAEQEQDYSQDASTKIEGNNVEGRKSDVYSSNGSDQLSGNRASATSSGRKSIITRKPSMSMAIPNAIKNRFSSTTSGYSINDKDSTPISMSRGTDSRVTLNENKIGHTNRINEETGTGLGNSRNGSRENTISNNSGSTRGTNEKDINSTNNVIESNTGRGEIDIISPMELYDLIREYSVPGVDYTWGKSHSIGEDFNYDNKISLDIGQQIYGQVGGTPEHLYHLSKTIIEICGDQKDADCLMILVHIIAKYRVPIIYKREVTRFGEEHITFMQRLLYLHDNFLYNHLTNTVFQRDPTQWIKVFQPWYLSLFSSQFPSQVLESIWDIYFGGAPAMLPYLGLSILLSCSSQILSMSKLQDLINFVRFGQPKYGDLDAIANRAIELWERPVLDRMPKNLRNLLTL